MAFDYPTNFSNGTNVDSLGTLMQYGNYVTNDYLGAALLIIIFLMTFMVSIATNVKRALSVASFVTFPFSIYLLRIGLINESIPIILVIGMIVGLLGSKSEVSI